MRPVPARVGRRTRWRTISSRPRVHPACAMTGADERSGSRLCTARTCQLWGGAAPRVRGGSRVSFRCRTLPLSSAMLTEHWCELVVSDEPKKMSDTLVDYARPLIDRLPDDHTLQELKAVIEF